MISFQGVHKSFGSKVVLKDLCFELEPEKIYSLLGESGSGKTTALRLMNRLLAAESGNIKIFGKPIDNIDPVSLRRKMGYAIQGSGLFPHMTIKENISLVAKQSGWSKNKINQRADELMEMVNLPPKQYLHLKPRQISGGQKQRVGFVRALFLKPKLVLMDEPFSALDPITREEVQDEFLSMQKKLKFTAMIVTHDLSEAFKLSDKVLMLNQGNLDQFDKPSEIINNPKTDYVKKLVSRFLKSREINYV
mgnify:CR=1 FL=1